MIQARSAAHAKAYFADALMRADYYLDGQELNGHVQGKLAERLGIAGPASKENFFALCENAHPKTSEPLTPRTKEERRVGYDVNFHCPKSVSILHALSSDDHLLKAFEQSVQETMRDMEADAKTRVRKGGQYDDRYTGELVWADFTHQTARPVDGSAPDPHLHSHCFVFNMTWDEQEQQIKAGQFGDIKRDMPYYQAAFHKRLSDNLIDLGYQVRRTEKSFEVKGVPERVIELFSKRSDEIGRFAQERGITDAKELSDLGARTRAKKQKGLSMSELKAEWKRQILELGPEVNEGNSSSDRDLRFAPQKQKIDLTAAHCVEHAISHGFERASVLQDRRLLAAAFRHGLGNAQVNVKDIAATFAADKRIIHVKEKGRTLCTTRAVLAEEKHMVELARQGQGKLTPLFGKVPEIDKALDTQQRDAVEHILTTPHRVSIVRGVAGAGKTTLLKEAVKHIEDAGRKVVAVTQSSSASRGTLREAGFADAETVAKLLVDKTLQDKLHNQVLLVDEAGLLGTRDMTPLLDLAAKQNARLILVGDTRQHASVDRGDALRILNTVAGIKTAEVSTIYRQRNERYKAAVKDLSEGDVRLAFDKLDDLDFIKTIDPLSPNAQLVDDYIQAIKDKKTCLIVSPTHAQGDAVTVDIRAKLKSIGKLGKKDVQAVRLQKRNLTEAAKADLRNYQPGQVVQFNQNVRDFERGSLWTVESAGDTDVRLKNKEGKTALLPQERARHFDLFDKGSIHLAKGDKVRVTRNGFDESRKIALNLEALKSRPKRSTKQFTHEAKPLLSIDKEGKRLDNGDQFEVVSAKKNGLMTLRSSGGKGLYYLDPSFGHLAHAYCTTSHASQGKTVDEVFISQPAATFLATDAKQFYVSVSRGRERCRIYTDDKEQLLEHAAELSDRQSALELVSPKDVNQKDKQMERTHQIIRQDIEREPYAGDGRKQIEKTPSPLTPTITPKEPDYEPGL